MSPSIRILSLLAVLFLLAGPAAAEENDARNELIVHSPQESQSSEQELNENGWQYLTWGMSPEDVSRAMRGKGQYYDGRDHSQPYFICGFDSANRPRYLFIDRIPDPERLSWVASGIEDTDFLFYDNRLFGVLIGKSLRLDLMRSLYQSMAQKYPEGFTYRVPDTNSLIFSYYSDRRIILWLSNDREVGLSFFDIITLEALAAAGEIASDDLGPVVFTPVPPLPDPIDPLAVPGMDAGLQPTLDPADKPLLQPVPADQAVPDLDAVQQPEILPDTPNMTIQDIWEEPTTGIRFIAIPGGCFYMGQSESGIRELTAINGDAYGSLFGTELPRFKACVDSFFMSITEVTNQQYKALVPGHVSGHALDGDNQPVVRVSWDDARRFAEQLSEKHPNRTFLLPTEAQWEYACRAGTNTTRWWGDDPSSNCSHANVGDMSTSTRGIQLDEIHPCDDGHPIASNAGSFPPNAFGLQDMLGNVWEWTRDRYGDYYPLQAQPNNPFNADGYGTERSIRGGSWRSPAHWVRSAAHQGLEPDASDIDVGFRLIMLVDGL